MKILDLFRKHDRVLTVVGALIAAITFLVKDNLLENAKERSDALAKAEIIMLLTTSLDGTNQMVLSIARATDFLKARIDPAGSPDVTRGTPRIEDKNEAFQARYNAKKYALEQVKRLSSDLPDSERYKSEIETERGLLNELATQEAPAFTSLITIYQHLPNAEKRPDKWDKTVNCKFDPLFSQMESIEKKSNAIVANIISETEEAKKDADQSYQRFRIASFVLIGFAGTLALIGKLAGTDKC
ncbi:MAG: hypothetical protein WAN35_21705, partial [Terracidiphilus sp.]